MWGMIIGRARIETITATIMENSVDFFPTNVSTLDISIDVVDFLI
jgi:hypothetical protein